MLLPDSGFFDRVRDLRAGVVDFVPPDLDPVDRFEPPREVAVAVFEPLRRDEILAEVRDFDAALLREVLDLDLLALAAGRLLLLFAPVREPAALDRRRVADDFVLRLLLPVRRTPEREPLVLRVLRRRRALRPPPVCVMPPPAISAEPAISVSSIFMSDPFLRAMSVS